MAAQLLRPWGQSKPTAGWQSNPSAVADLGIVGAWLLNEGGGGLVYEHTQTPSTSPNIYPAVLSDPLGRGVGLFGGTCVGNGTSQRIDLPDPTSSTSSYKIPVPCTIACWVRVDQSDTSNGMGIVCNDALFITGQNYSGLQLGTWGDGHFYAGVGTGGAPGPTTRFSQLSSSTYTQAQWYRIVAVFNAANSISLYINGSLNNGTTDGTGSSLGYSTNPGAFMAGSLGRAGVDYLKGAIELPLICRVAWTVDQVHKDWQNPFWWMQGPKPYRVYVASGGAITVVSSITQAANTNVSAVTNAIVSVSTTTQAANTNVSAVTNAIVSVSTTTQAANTNSSTVTAAIAVTSSTTQAANTNSGAGTLAIAINASASQASDTNVGTLDSPNITCNSSTTQAGDTNSAALTVAISVSASTTQAGQTNAGALTVAITVSAASTQASQTNSGALTVASTVSASSSQANQTNSGACTVATTCSGSTSQGNNGNSSGLTVAIAVNASITQAPDTNFGLMDLPTRILNSSTTQDSQFNTTSIIVTGGSTRFILRLDE